MANIKGLMGIAKAFMNTHSTELLVAIGITGMATSTIMAAKKGKVVAPKLEKALAEHNLTLFDEAVRRGDTTYVPATRLSHKKVIQLCWKDYAGVALTGVAGAVCIVGGTKISLRKNAALMTACKLSEMTIKDLQQYKDTVESTLDEKTAKVIDDIVDNKKVDEVLKDVDISKDSSFIEGVGDVIYVDKMGGRIFRSSKEAIREAINTLNHTLNDDRYVSLNDLYSELHLQPSLAGEQLGWNIDHGLIEPRFGSELSRNGVAIVTFNTRIEPRINYMSMWG